MSNDNKNMNQILFQSRKRDVDIFLSMQLLRTIDVNYRSLIDKIIKCYKNEDLERYEYLVLDKDGYKIMYITFNNARQIYNWYNTNEVIFNEKNLNQLKYSD